MIIVVPQGILLRDRLGRLRSYMGGGVWDHPGSGMT